MLRSNSQKCQQRDTLTVGFNLASDWLRRWRGCFGPITGRSKYKFSEPCITCDTQLRKPLLTPCLLHSGYGDFYPVTVIGKVVCGLYAVFGIPTTILLLRFIGQQMLRGERALITAIERSCLKRNGPPCHLNEKCFVFGCLYLLILVLGGAGASMVTEEGWSYGGSIYFYVITFTTVGFGDMYPQKGRHVTIPFIFLGLTAISNILHAAAAWALVRRVTAGSDESEETTKLTESTEKGTEV